MLKRVADHVPEKRLRQPVRCIPHTYRVVIRGTRHFRAYRATFVGFFPADNPQITVLVTIDEPDPTSKDRFGGTASAPLFATIATSAIHELQIVPSPGDTGCPAAG